MSNFSLLSFFFISFQFEGGLYATSKVVYASYALSEFLGKAPAITEVSSGFIRRWQQEDFDVYLSISSFLLCIEIQSNTL